MFGAQCKLFHLIFQGSTVGGSGWIMVPKAAEEKSVQCKAFLGWPEEGAGTGSRAEGAWGRLGCEA